MPFTGSTAIYNTMGFISQKITPFLWFDYQAEEAARFYTSVFRNSKITGVTHYTEAGHETHGMPAGMAMTVSFELEGQSFTALNGGAALHLLPAISFVVNCETQEEVDYYWETLSEGGDPLAQQCGWLADKFGVSWQIVPAALGKLLGDPDHEKAGRVMNAMLKMKKIVTDDLKKAYHGA